MFIFQRANAVCVDTADCSQFRFLSASEGFYSKETRAVKNENGLVRYQEIFEKHHLTVKIATFEEGYGYYKPADQGEAISTLRNEMKVMQLLLILNDTCVHGFVENSDLLSVGKHNILENELLQSRSELNVFSRECTKTEKNIFRG